MINAAAALKALGHPAPARPKEAQEVARELVREGMPIAVVERLAKTFDTSIDVIQRIIGVSPATGTRSRSRRAPLRPLPSDRAFRMASVYALAEHVFENAENARAWFKEPNRALHGERPLDLLDTEAGTQNVVRILKRIEFGLYS